MACGRTPLAAIAPTAFFRGSEASAKARALPHHLTLGLDEL